LKFEKAILGAGCFWHVEEYYSKLNGVLSTRVGYACGTSKDPNYKDICTGNTGHVEVVEITFNPKIIKYDILLKHFWHIHDPTSLDKQGPDIGSQYKSAICIVNEIQKETALKAINEIKKKYNKKIVTLICFCKKFYIAEAYHQKYLKKNPGYMKTCNVPDPLKIVDK
tara:strand:+ start:101 stop:604 length:504 start_codon:yes stop_codon:yes gene_type:complete